MKKYIILTKAHLSAIQLFETNIHNPVPLPRIVSDLWDSFPRHYSHDRLTEIVWEAWDIFTGLYDDRDKNFYPSCDYSIRSIRIS